MLRAEPHQQKLKNSFKKRSTLHLFKKKHLYMHFFKKKKANNYTTKRPMLLHIMD